MTTIHIATFSDNLYEAATYYCNRGFSLFPVQLITTVNKDGLTKLDKKPLCKWREQSTSDSAQFVRMLEQRKNIPGLALGLDCGKSGLFALDVDVRNGAQGMASLARLEAHYGALPQTWVSRTPSGGLHYWFKGEGRNSASSPALGPNLDTRGNGGYIVVPPSIADSGEAYQWENPPDIFDLADVPVWLLDLTQKNVVDSRSDRHTGGEHWDTTATADMVTEGARNDTLFKRACGLRARGLKHSEILGAIHFLNQDMCTPPLSNEEVNTLVNSAMGYDENEELIKTQDQEETLHNLREAFQRQQDPTQEAFDNEPDTPTGDRLSAEDDEEVLRHRIQALDHKGLTREAIYTHIAVMRLGLNLQRRLEILNECFPEDALHCFGQITQDADAIIKQLVKWNERGRHFLTDPEILTYLKEHCTYNKVNRQLVGRFMNQQVHIPPQLFWEVIDARHITTGDFDPGKIYSLRELSAMPDMKPHWMVDGVFAQRSLSMITGLPKVGKSSLIRDLMKCLATGTRWLGRPIEQPFHVGYLCLEDPPELYVEAMKSLLSSLLPLDDAHLDHIDVTFRVRPDDLLRTLKVFLERGVQFFLIDTFIRAVGACDNTNYSEMVFKIDPLNVFAKEHNVHILLIHHNTKQNSGDTITSSHGSVGIPGSVDNPIMLYRESEHAPTQMKSRNRFPANCGGFDFKEEVLQYEESTGAFWLSPPPPPKEQVQALKKLQVPAVLVQLLAKKFQETNGQEGLSRATLCEQVRDRLLHDPQFPNGIGDKKIDEAYDFGVHHEWFQKHPTHNYRGHYTLTIHEKFWENFPALDAEVKEQTDKAGDEV